MYEILKRRKDNKENKNKKKQLTKWDLLAILISVTILIIDLRSYDDETKQTKRRNSAMSDRSL